MKNITLDLLGWTLRCIVLIACAACGSPASTSNNVASSAGSSGNVAPMTSSPAASVQASGSSRHRCVAPSGNERGAPRKQTNEMPLSPAVRDIVQQLQERCDWEQLRFQLAKPTRRAELTQKLTSTWTKEEALSLLEHEAANVRGYVAYEIVRQFPDSASLVRPVLADDVLIPLGWLDYAEHSPLSTLLAMELCELASSTADAELLWALEHGPLTLLRRTIFACVRIRRPVEAAAVAFRLLRNHSDVEAIRTLGFDPLPDYAPVVLRFAQSTSAADRLAAALVLPAFDDVTVSRGLETLMPDSDPRVQAAARVTGWRVGRTTSKEIWGLLARKDDSGQTTVEALAWFPTEKTLSLLEQYLSIHTDDETVLHTLTAQKSSPGLLRRVRQWIPRFWQSSDGQSVALRYLTECRDAEAASLFAKTVRRKDFPTSVWGARGLAAIGTASAPHVGDLENAMDANNAFVVVGAAEALLALKRRSSISRIREVRARLPTEGWAERRLGEIIAAMETMD